MVMASLLSETGMWCTYRKLHHAVQFQSYYRNMPTPPNISHHPQDRFDPDPDFPKWSSVRWPPLILSLGAGPDEVKGAYDSAMINMYDDIRVETPLSNPAANQMQK